MDGKHSKYVSPYILDNGGFLIKIGNCREENPRLIPNCIMKVKSERRRPFIGDQIEECRDASGLFYILPFQKGYIVNWDIQKTVWDYVFSKELHHGKLTEVPLCITEPVMNFQSVQEAMDEIFFEEYECCAIVRTTPAELSGFHYASGRKGVDSCIIIDTGYSFTHLVPFINGKKYLPGVKRLDIGGKVLTNHLKEIISYRQLHVMDETYVINQMKEDACYLSKNFLVDMKTTMYKDARNTILRDYILPDFNKIRRGYLQTPSDINAQIEIPHPSSKTNAAQSSTNPREVKISNDGEQQSIRLNNERITIPEILFHPSDIGITQKGIAEAVIECVESCPPSAKYQLLANIVVTGGNAKFPNFQERMYNEVRKNFDENLRVNIYVPENPVTYAWEGGQKLAKSEMFHQFTVSRREYEEYGSTFSNAHQQNFTITM